MIELTKKTIGLVNNIFLETDKSEVIELLKNECAENLFLDEKSIDNGIERIRFAAIKFSDGNLDKLYYAINLAQEDWRDLLVATDFANDINAHEVWAKSLLGI